MTIFATTMKEEHLQAAEAEHGKKFVASFRKFLLNDKILILDQDNFFENPLQIVPRATFDRNYVIVKAVSSDFVEVGRL